MQGQPAKGSRYTATAAAADAAIGCGCWLSLSLCVPALSDAAALPALLCVQYANEVVDLIKDPAKMEEAVDYLQNLLTDDEKDVRRTHHHPTPHQQDQDQQHNAGCVVVL